EWNWVKNISVVYTWVDGSDIDFLDLKFVFNGGIRKVNSRDRSADELRYSLRSLQKYMPWHEGMIYIVTSQQIPKWLDTSHPRIKIIYHKDIFPPYIYPTYDSNTIELFFDKIPGITERFLYFNDDVFLNHYIHPCFFFTSNTFYPKYQFKSFDSKPSEIIISSFSSKNNNSYNYTSSLLFQYFGTNYINIYRELKDAPIPLYRDLFPPTRELFQEEWTSLYTTNSYKQKLKTFMYDILPLYLVINFNIYGAAQPLYPEYIPGYGKIQ
ncbi:hypothetical protein BCR36DRAFT_235123, partial [Piromyces finnis]